MFFVSHSKKEIPCLLWGDSRPLPTKTKLLQVAFLRQVAFPLPKGAIRRSQEGGGSGEDNWLGSCGPQIARLGVIIRGQKRHIRKKKHI